MNGGRLNDKQITAQLAKDFNDFYLKITSKTINQIGNYEIIEEIGEGSFGKVYLANHILLNMPVVLKCGLTDDPNIVREVFYHRQLKHKNIVKLYEVIKTETHLWLVMEYCQGNELYYHIYEKRRLEFKEVQQIFFQIIQAIKYVHSLNLVHRDLKLENILFGDKKRNTVKLTDFGFVREFDPIKRNFLSTICGTTVYMAPEVLKSEKYNGMLTDIWSLGIILYTMLYGTMPFDEEDDLKTKFKIVHEEPIYTDDIPSSAINLIKRMLDKNPTRRPNLNDILNSEFLINITNKFPEKAKRSSSMALTDSESIMSMTQHQNSGLPPFQSKIVKHLLKNFKKSDIKIERLQNDVNNGEMNSLTALYELALTREFYKKKKKYYKNSRRARRSLSKSKRKVKSVLSLSEEGSQPLERIMSTLSLNSKNQSKSNLARKSSEKFNERRLSSERRISTDKRRSLVDSNIYQSENSTPPFNRTVSFFPNGHERRSSISSALNIMSERKNLKKNSRLRDRLQFWKKKDDEINGLFRNDVLRDQISDITLNSPSPKTVADDQLPIISNFQDETENDSIILQPNKHPLISNSNSPINNSTETSIRMKNRPSSMVSQMSQVSHLSQLSTMLSESELEMIIDSDSMDDFEEELYESSIVTSTYDNQKSSKRKSRPIYRRQPSSDVSIASMSTTTTSRPLQSTSINNLYSKKSSLSQVSSNSSEESSDILSPISTIPYRAKKFSLPRSSSPENISLPRSSSPPLPTKFKVKPKLAEPKGRMFEIVDVAEVDETED